MNLRNRVRRIDIGTKLMPGYARQTLNFQNSLGRHRASSNPLGNRLLGNAKQPSHLGLPSSFLNRRREVTSYRLIHEHKHYRYFLFFQQANLVGKTTGTPCSFTAMPKKAGKDPEKVRIGLAIGRARAKHGFTQVTLAKELGVTQQSVGEWERGETLPRGNRLSKLLRVLPSLRSIFHDVARVAHHFSLSVQDYAILSPEQQTQVDAQIGIIEDTLKRAAAQGSFKAPPKS